MKGNLLLLSLLASSLYFSSPLSAQLFIDNSYTAEQMVIDFFDSDSVSISNVALIGDSGLNMAYFEAANTDLGIPAGILLTTGVVYDAIGPNSQENTSTDFGFPGYYLLDSILFSTSGGSGLTRDAVVLTFDLTTSFDSLDFSYVFGSEEYTEFVGSAFNDVFAFVVSGPGYPNNYNIAMVPGTPIPVSINNVNQNINTQFFQFSQGSLFNDFEYDGFTTKLPAPFVVTPNQTYHVEIGIADVSDGIYDSGVFLGIESLMGDSILRPPAEIGFEQDGSVVDFNNLSRYATSYFWDFGDNTTSTERYPGTHYYTSPGEYTVTLITENYCCNDTTTVQITVDQVTSNQEVVRKPYRVFPNPVVDQLTIQWPSGIPYTAVLYDNTGRTLWAAEQAGDLQKDLTAFDKGVYWLHLITANQVFTERIVRP
ncbi:MAG: choice-of-anchor L domain-containing protein [Bacteroidota bacterium]